MTTENLLSKLASVFPHVNKPEGKALSFHSDDCFQCEYLRKNLKAVTGKELSPESIRVVHQEMSCLSAQGWRWVLPSYLKYCLSQPHEYWQLETEFLIYNLSPTEEHREETKERLSALTLEQVRYLIDFLKWCGEHEYWGEYCEGEISSGKEFLSSIFA